MTSMPLSPSERMRRPAPCLSVMTASGSVISSKGRLPEASTARLRAIITGSLGGAKGILSITTSESASPLTSTPSQKLIEPTSTALPCALNSSMRRILGPSP